MRTIRYGIAAAAALTFTQAWAGDAPQAAQDADGRVAVEERWSDAKPAQVDGASGTAEAGAAGDVASDEGDRSTAKHYTVGIEAPDPQHSDASSVTNTP